MSEIAEHTPGPWSIQQDQSEWDEGRIVQIVSGDYTSRGIRFISPVCQIEVTSWEQDEDGNETVDPAIMADARLIAAAPDLLEALKAMLAHSCVADADPEDKDPEDHDAERKALVAIAKATGAP